MTCCFSSIHSHIVKRYHGVRLGTALVSSTCRDMKEWCSVHASINERHLAPYGFCPWLKRIFLKKFSFRLLQFLKFNHSEISPWIWKNFSSIRCIVDRPWFVALPVHYFCGRLFATCKQSTSFFMSPENASEWVTIWSTSSLVTGFSTYIYIESPYLVPVPIDQYDGHCMVVSVLLSVCPHMMELYHVLSDNKGVRKYYWHGVLCRTISLCIAMLLRLKVAIHRATKF